MYIFKSKTESYYSAELGSYNSCAIEVYDISEKRVLYIPDVFVNKERAEEVVEMMNICQPELVHIEELCVDFIG